jgi:hypothetical protein
MGLFDRTIATSAFFDPSALTNSSWPECRRSNEVQRPGPEEMLIDFDGLGTDVPATVSRKPAIPHSTIERPASGIPYLGTAMILATHHP